MKNGRMQSKDIDDRSVLAAVRELSLDLDGGVWSAAPHWVMAGDLERKLGLMAMGISESDLPPDADVEVSLDAEGVLSVRGSARVQKRIGSLQVSVKFVSPKSEVR